MQELVFYTIPIFIGCGVVVFASIFALFALVLSWYVSSSSYTVHSFSLLSLWYSLVDSIRKYFTVAFLTHLSFIFSVLAAYATYIVGTDLAVEERVSVGYNLNLPNKYQTPFTYYKILIVFCNLRCSKPYCGSVTMCLIMP